MSFSRKDSWARVLLFILTLGLLIYSASVLSDSLFLALLCWSLALIAVLIASWLTAYVSYDNGDGRRDTALYRIGCHQSTEYAGGDTFESTYQLNFRLGPVYEDDIPTNAGYHVRSRICDHCRNEVRIEITPKVLVFASRCFQGVVSLGAIVLALLAIHGWFDEDALDAEWLIFVLFFGVPALLYYGVPLYPFGGSLTGTYVRTGTSQHTIFGRDEHIQ